MKESDWESLANLLAVAVVAVVAVAVVAVAVVAVAVVAVVAVAVVAVAVVAETNPKLSCCISLGIIAVCIATLTQTLPIALNPPQTVEVICQITQSASPTIIIHDSITQTITGANTVVNSTTTEIASKVACP